MFDRFTERARKAMGLSREAAIRNRHDYIAPEHILLGLLETHGVAADVLKELKVKPRKLAGAVVKRLPAGGPMITAGQLPFTPKGKLLLERALEEANGLGHSYIGTEHLLLGLVLDDGVAGTVLRKAGLDAESVCRTIRELLGMPADEGASARSSALVLGSKRAAADALARPALAAAGFERISFLDPEGVDTDRLEDRCAAADLAVVLEPTSASLVYAAGLCRGAGTPTIVFLADADALPEPLASLPVVSTAEELRDILKPKEP